MPDPGMHQLDPFATALTDATTKAPILAEEMVEAIDFLVTKAEGDVRRAVETFGGTPNPERMRQIAAGRRAVDVMERVKAHKDKVLPILFAAELEEVRREKAYRAKKERERREGKA